MHCLGGWPGERGCAHVSCSLNSSLKSNCLVFKDQVQNCALQVSDLDPFILTNSNGMEAHILPYGAIVNKLLVPDAIGELQDIVLGFDQLAPYEVGHQ